MNKNIGKVPDALLRWIDKPCADWYLGERILREMKNRTNVMGYAS